MMQTSPFNFRRTVIWIGRLLLGGIFFYAGYARLPLGLPPRPPIGVALSFFALQVDSYQILPTWAVKIVANSLPFAEIGFGLLLLIRWKLRNWATLITMVLLVLFFALARSYAIELQIHRGCFANPEPMT